MPSLGRYLSTIYEDKYLSDRPPQSRILRFKQYPQLDRNRTNVILVYRGSFNPPHRGHLAMLWHVDNQLAKDLNILSAFIRPLADDVVKKKNIRKKKQSIIVSHKDLARLWKDDLDFPPWAWVFDGINCGFSDLEEQIQLLARKDKCRIRFAHLCGPDCVEKSPDDDIDYQMTLVSDVAREFAQGQCHGCPTFHPTCFGPWEVDNSISSGGNPTQCEETMQQEQEALNKQREIGAGKDRAQRAVDEVSSSVPTLGASMLQGPSDLAVAKVDGLLGLAEERQTPAPPAMKETLAIQLARLGNPCSVKVCWQEGGTQRKSFRCLLTTPEQHQPFRGISSSRIQEMMHELKGYKLKSALESIALSPDLLWDMLLPKRMQFPGPRTGLTNVSAVYRSRNKLLVKLPLDHARQWMSVRGKQTVDDLILPSKKYSTEFPFTSTTIDLAKDSTVSWETQDAESLGPSRKTPMVMSYSGFYNKWVGVSLRQRIQAE